jgi:hypothetical protein
MAFELNYDDLILLDSEELAEEGIAQAYAWLLPELRKHVEHPAPIEELTDHDAPSYKVRCGAEEFLIHGPGLPEDDRSNSWGRATHAIFAIVNAQMAGSPYRFYAFNGGNDLAGMFLTAAQVEEARDTLPDRVYWPYIPNDEPPWYGMYH